MPKARAKTAVEDGAVGNDTGHSDDAIPSVSDAGLTAELTDISTGQMRPESDGPANSPTDEAIRALAYSKWEAAGRAISDGIEFWLEAEREIYDANSGHGKSTDEPQK